MGMPASDAAPRSPLRVGVCGATYVLVTPRRHQRVVPAGEVSGVPFPVGPDRGTMEGVSTVGDELLEARRRRRRAGDPRITPAGRRALLRLVTGDGMDDFQASLDADEAADPALSGD